MSVIEVEDPSTEEIIGSVPAVGAAGVDAAVRAAAASDWPRSSPVERAALLEDVADRLDAARDALGELVSREVGTPIAYSGELHVGLPAAVFRQAAAEARALDAPAERVAAAEIVEEPAGVVAAITPWNFPLHQIAAKAAYALAAGCTVVLKPSELAPLNALELASMLAEAGLPDGAFGVATGVGAVEGEALVTHPLVDVVSLTGSVRAGRRVGALAGERIKRVALELGGKSASVVLDDAPLEDAVRHGVARGFLNSGQACNAATRILVPKERLAEAEEIAADEASRIVVGPALDPATRMGPVVSAAQRARVVSFLQDTPARVVCGGTGPVRDVGHFLLPTVLSDVRGDMAVAREEIFGPVLCLLGHAGEDDAVAQANDTVYGLSAELWTDDADGARRVARRLRAGQVKVNGVRTRDALAAPFGGRGDSGVGRELGRWGLHEFLEVKAVIGV